MRWIFYIMHFLWVQWVFFRKSTSSTVRILGGCTGDTARSFCFERSLCLLPHVLVPAAQPPNNPRCIWISCEAESALGRYDTELNSLSNYLCRSSIRSAVEIHSAVSEVQHACRRRTKRSLRAQDVWKLWWNLIFMALLHLFVHICGQFRGTAVKSCDRESLLCQSFLLQLTVKLNRLRCWRPVILVMADQPHGAESCLRS
jgi:hypothetical protein